jgi:hypothetical protein
MKCISCHNRLSFNFVLHGGGVCRKCGVAQRIKRKYTVVAVFSAMLAGFLLKFYFAFIVSIVIVILYAFGAKTEQCNHEK